MKQTTVLKSDIIPQQALGLIKVNYYSRKDGTPCADVKVRDPITRETLVKQVTAKVGGEVLKKKAIAAAETLYRQVRPDFLKCALLAGSITLQSYLELDLPFLKEKWPKSYGEKEYAALLCFAKGFPRAIPTCSNADDFCDVLSALNISHELEVIVLRMVRDVIDELIKLNLYHSSNPISDYYSAANSAIRRKKREQRNISSVALPQSIMHDIYKECLEHFRTDPRYLAIPLRAIGLSTDIIAALNFEDIICIGDDISILITTHSLRGDCRYVRRDLTNEWKVRLLPIGFLRDAIVYWKFKYEQMGVANVGKASLCAAGCRKQPKRCIPDELEKFLTEIINRHVPAPPGEMRPSSKKAAGFEYRTAKLSSQCLYETFLACGSGILDRDPLAARYILGQEALTVDEKVYTDRTHPLQQRYLGEMIEAILYKVGFRKEDSNED